MRRTSTTKTISFQRVTVGLGTFVAIQARGPLDVHAQTRTLDRACEVFETVGETMHPTAPGSDLVRIAAAAPGTAVAVHAWTYEVLLLSQRLSRASGGHFDPCIPDSAATIADLQFVQPDSVCAPRPVLIDLGGIAKGFAIDKAVEVLLEQGCSRGLVNAGGDVRAFGPDSYEIDLQIPGESGRLQLTSGALAVSAPKSARSPSGHRGFYSRVTGATLSGRALGVFAPTAAVADALTKCALACEQDILRRLLDEFCASLLMFD